MTGVQTCALPICRRIQSPRPDGQHRPPRPDRAAGHGRGPLDRRANRLSLRRRDRGDRRLHAILFENFIQSGFTDSFRHFNQEPHQYSWWSYRAGSRSKNLGWRIDYNLVSNHLEKNLKRSVILPDAMHSDHCPVLLEIEF